MDVPAHLHLDGLQFRNVSYFSFFSELRHSDHMATTLETLVLTAVFLTSIIANVGAVFLVVRERGMLVNKAVLTLNLFVADLLFISMIPLIVAVRWTVSWTLGYAACHTVMYVISMSGCVTITTLACISMERVLAILRLQTAPTLSPRTLCVTLAGIWAFSALTSLPLSLFFTVMEESLDETHMQICTLMWPTMIGEIVWNVAFTGLCFLLPGLIIVFSYSKILQLSKRSRRRLHPRENPSEPSDVRHYSVSRQDIKLFRTLFVLMLSFFIMWSPIFIITFLILLRNFQSLFISSTTFLWVVTFTLANSALNPILYSVCQFRHGWRHLCCASVVAPLKRGSRTHGHRQENGPTTLKVFAI